MVGNRKQPYELCQFDENGELETDDSEVIRQLINIYRHDETWKKEGSAGDATAKCKKCGAKFENKGLLMAHYKSSHPKKR
jgi:hypothetical protein